jgi:hypothetical protein
MLIMLSLAPVSAQEADISFVHEQIDAYGFRNFPSPSMALRLMFRPR